MDDITAIESALDKMRGGLRHDGADLQLKSWENGTVEVDLIISEDACLKCIVDSMMMKMNLRRLLKQALPSVEDVVLNDPRES